MYLSVMPPSSLESVTHSSLPEGLASPLQTNWPKTVGLPLTVHWDPPYNNPSKLSAPAVGLPLICRVSLGDDHDAVGVGRLQVRIPADLHRPRREDRDALGDCRGEPTSFGNWTFPSIQ